MNEFESLVLSLPGVWERVPHEELYELLLPAYGRRLFVLDLSGTVFIGDDILDALSEMESYRTYIKGFEPTRIVVTSRHLKRVLELSRLDESFEIYATLPDALLASFKTTEQEAL